MTTTAHFRLWEKAEPIEPERCRRVGRFPLDESTVLPDCCWAVRDEDGLFSVFVEKPELPRHLFRVYILPNKRAYLVHCGTGEPPVDDIAAAARTPSATIQFLKTYEVEYRLVDWHGSMAPTDVAELAILQFVTLPQSMGKLNASEFWLWVAALQTTGQL